MKKLMLLLLPLFLSAEPDVHKETITPFEGFLCCRCTKNELHDYQIALAIKCIVGCISTIAGVEGFKAGKTYIQKASLTVIGAGLTYGFLRYIGSLVLDKLVIIGPDYKCHKMAFCKYAPKTCVKENS